MRIFDQVNDWIGAGQRLVLRKRRLGFEFSLTLLSTGLNALMSLASIKVLSGRLSKESYADYALSLTVTALAAMFFYGPLSASCSKFLLIAEAKGEVAFFYDSVRLLFRRSIRVHVGFAMIVSIGFILSDLRHSLLLALIVTSISAAFLGRLSIYESIYASRRDRVSALKVSMLATGCRVGGVTLAVLVGFENVFCALLVSGATLALAEKHVCRQLGFAEISFVNNIKLTEEYSRNLAQYTWPVSLWTLPQWLQQSVDRWILDARFGPSLTAEFAVLNSIFANPLNLLASAIHQFALPVLYQRASLGGNAVVRDLVFVTAKSILLLIVLTVPFIAVSSIHPDILISFLSNDRYLAVGEHAVPLVCASILVAAANFITFPIFVLGDFKLLGPWKQAVSFVGFVAIGAGAYLLSIQGAVLGLLLFGLLSFVSSAFVLLLFLRRESKRRVYDEY